MNFAAIPAHPPNGVGPSSAAVSAPDVHAALDKIVSDSLRSVAVGLGILCLVFAASHPFVLPTALASPLTLAATVTALVLLGTSFLLGRWPAPPGWAHPLAAGIAGAALFNALLHLFLVPEPWQTTNLMLLAIGVGSFFLSARWLVLMLAAIGGGWGMVVWTAPASSAWVHFGFALFSSMALAVLVHTIRVHTYSRLERLRLEGEYEGVALEGALRAVRQARAELEQRVRERTADLLSANVALEAQIAERKRVTESLLRFSHAVQASADSVVLTDIQGNIVEANAATLTMYGTQDKTDLVGKSAFELIVPEDRPRALAGMEEVLAAEHIESREYRIHTASGGSLPVEMSVSLIKDAGGTSLGFVGISRDITERRRAEEALRQLNEDLERRVAERTAELAESEERYRELFENASDALVSLTLEGTITRVNVEAERLSGYSREEAIGHHFSRFLTAASATSAQERLLRSLVGEEVPSFFELEWVHKDGSVVPVEGWSRYIRGTAGELLSIETAFRDITERKRLREQVQQYATELEQKVVQRTAELQERQRFIEQIANTTPALLYLYDFIKNRTIYVNDHITEVLGYTPAGAAQARAGAVVGIIHPEDLMPVLERVRRYNTAGDGETLSLEYRIRHRNGEWRWVHDRATVFARTADGTPYRVLGSIQDITERKQAEAALRQATKAAEAANQAKSEFLAMMSHEMRTPLNVIMGYTDLLSAGAFGPLTSKQAETLRRVGQKAREQRELISAVLDLVSVESGHMRVSLTEVRVPQLLQEVEAECQELRERSGLAWVWTSEPSLPPVYTDRGKLKVVLRNLVGNAVKFTPCGSITVSARGRGQGVELSVADTGVGMPPEALGSIFEPFYQLDSSDTRQYGGVGLGLHIVRRLAELLGGTVTVESEVSRGSTFRVWLPERASPSSGGRLDDARSAV